MSRSGFSKSHTFMMEFIIVVLFFSICAATCIMAFAKADAVSKGSRELNRGMLIAQSAAETFKAYGATDQALAYYDADFKPCEAADGVYILEVQCDLKSEMKQAVITVSKNTNAAEEICKLEVKKYLPGEV